MRMAQKCHVHMTNFGACSSGMQRVIFALITLSLSCTLQEQSDGPTDRVDSSSSGAPVGTTSIECYVPEWSSVCRCGGVPSPPDECGCFALGLECFCNDIQVAYEVCESP